MLEFDGEVWGKAESASEVVRRWKRLRGGRGFLHTGHFVTDSGRGAVAEETDTAVVHFGTPADHEIEAYSMTAESRRVAGPFTLEGRSGPWIDGIEGDYGTILGISLPVLRRLLARIDVEIIDLWH
jgi:septum formation protein